MKARAMVLEGLQIACNDELAMFTACGLGMAALEMEMERERLRMRQRRLPSHLRRPFHRRSRDPCLRPFPHRRAALFR
jgi:hypothetical protein